MATIRGTQTIYSILNPSVAILNPSVAIDVHIADLDCSYICNTSGSRRQYMSIVKSITNTFDWKIDIMAGKINMAGYFSRQAIGWKMSSCRNMNQFVNHPLLTVLIVLFVNNSGQCSYLKYILYPVLFAQSYYCSH